MAILLFSPWISSEMAKPRFFGLRWASHLLHICIYSVVLCTPSPFWSPSVDRSFSGRAGAGRTGNGRGHYPSLRRVRNASSDMLRSR
jgi:hypothetical protein